MHKRELIQIPFAALLAIVALSVSACSSKSPEERVADARSRYTATLNAFIVEETPVEEAAADEQEGTEGEATDSAAAGAEEAEEADGEGSEGEEEAPAPEVRQDVTLDLVVRHDLDTALPGVTLDVTQVSSDQTEKGAWKVWVETAGLPQANQKQFVHVLEDVDYEEGDGFHAEIRSSVPPEDYGDYQEFSAAAGGG